MTFSEPVIVAFAEMMVADAALGIDEIMRRPELVVEALPDLIIIVDRHGIGNAEFAHRTAHIVDILLESNSGACTPMTTSPLSLYFSAQSRT